MNKEKDIKNLDQFFKQGLEDPVDKAVFRDADWDALEQMLGYKRPGIVFWLPYLSSAAAILIVAFGWWMLRPQATDHAQKPQQQVAVNHAQKAQQPTVAGKTQLAAVTNQNQQVAAANVNGKNNINSADVKPVATGKPETELSLQPQHQTTRPAYIAANPVTNKRRVKGVLLPGETVNTEQNGSAGISQPVSAQTNTRDNEILAAVSETSGITPSNTMDNPVLTSIDILPKTAIGSSVPIAIGTDAAKAGKTTIKKTGVPYHPQYTLSILASQELNGVGSLQQASGGIDAGLLFSAGLVKKFTITTGLHYSLKPYTLPFNEYHTTYKFKNSPQTVSADCRIIDIPINIDYQVYNKYRNKITVGTGLSSYIMMHESYTYDYGSSGVLYGPSYYAVKTRGKYYFSIMNLEASYQRQVSSKFGVSLQPYLKIPLSNIGYSQIKVETFGVAAGLNWNINSLTKPK